MRLWSPEGGLPWRALVGILLGIDFEARGCVAMPLQEVLIRRTENVIWSSLVVAWHHPSAARLAPMMFGEGPVVLELPSWPAEGVASPEHAARVDGT